MAQAGINTLLSDAPWACAEINLIELNAAGLAAQLPLPEQRLPALDAGPDSLAYIIFTSGSTGTPKGVAIEHRSAVNMLEGVRRYFGLNERDRSLALSALSFDLAIFDIFSPLSAGGAVVMPAERDRSNPQAWYQLMMAHRVTQWLSAPALMELLLSVSASLNIYRRNGARNIGHAIANMRCYVIDEKDNLLPLGVEGELCLAGVGLARGYLNLPALTASTFVANPFELREPYRRLYRTGDRVRRLADGGLEYLGRHDQQIKINGYRIELGEIEMQLRALPEVAEAVVSLRPGCQ